MRRISVLLGAPFGVLVLTLGLAGCGSVSQDYEETGIDELVIPTPAPDPDDFVKTIDNPSLPYAQGNEWTYDVDDGGDTGTATVTVEPSNLLLEGVAVTVVRAETLIGKGPATETTDYYAQDRHGNVWWFGRAGEWDVTVAGAEAGLAMPADPRVGDGWRSAYLEGVVEDRLTVTKVDGGTVVLERASALEPGIVSTLEYDAGFGLLRSTGPSGTTELSSGP